MMQGNGNDNMHGGSVPSKEMPCHKLGPQGPTLEHKQTRIFVDEIPLSMSH